MVNLDLEFRGISRKQLGSYFEELGASLVSNSFPYIYKAENWQGSILKEWELSITTTFKVNAVKIRFEAEDLNSLEELIKKYRLKTTRVGG